MRLMTTWRNPGNRGGFTLVELLVSVTLTVFILTLMATLFAAGNDAVTASRGSSELDRNVHGAIAKLKRDLNHVFLGENATLGHAFSSPDQIPDAGYFTIEENIPASPPLVASDDTLASATPPSTNFIDALHDEAAEVTNPVTGTYSGNPGPLAYYRQGIDERGLPVEIDVDDVLAFTVMLEGSSESTFFRGRVPKGSILDNELNPGSRFDSPDNGIFTSPMAEVAYFLRADRPYRLAELNRPALGSDDGQLALAPTFTLYRRELLLLSEQQRVQVENRLLNDPITMDVAALQDMLLANSKFPNPQLQGNYASNEQYNPSFYQHYDVSASYRIHLHTGVPSLEWRFNDPTTVRERRNRYGMQWIDDPQMGSNVAGFILPNVPDAAVPGYNFATTGPRVLNEQLRLYVPGLTAASGVRKFFGRPTLFESTLVGAEGIDSANYNPADPTIYGGWNMTTRDYENPTGANVPQKTARRANADVLLRNVLSFDVKVFNDDVVQSVNGVTIPQDGTVNDFVPVGTNLFESNLPPDPSEWPAARTSQLAILDPNEGTGVKTYGAGTFLRQGRFVGNASLPATDDLGNLRLAELVQPDFVDLGATLRSEDFISNIAGDLGSTQSVNMNRPRPPFILNELPNVAQVSFSDGNFARNIPTGTHTPARWTSTGRPEAWRVGYNVAGFTPLVNVYDTWSPSYRMDQFVLNYNALDSLGNRVAVPWEPAPDTRPTTFPEINQAPFLPPYDRPLRGIQITIRILDPGSGLVREFQVVHRFR